MGTERSESPRVPGEVGTGQKTLQEEVKALLARHGSRPDKKFGQHFLVSEACVTDIVAQVSEFQGVLEIGPGPGILTKPLTESAAKVIAVELDDAILPLLHERAPNAVVVAQDALEADWKALLDDLPTPRAIVSNMPYNITGPLLTRVGEVKDQIGRAVLMMQREVGNRILAPAGDSNRGSLSVFLEARFFIRRLRKVPAGSFLPPPKVESIVLVLDPRPESVDPRLEPMVRAGFTQPRKTLANNLTAFFGTRVMAVERMDAAGLAENVRPHQLTLEQWIAILP